MTPATPKKTRWALYGGLVCGVVLLGCMGFVSALLGVIKRSDAYTSAVAKAKADPRVAEKIGTPITEGLIPQGSINTTNGYETADLRISLNGPKGSGVLEVRSRKSDGTGWAYDRLVFGPDDSSAVDLRVEPPREQPAD